MKALRPWAAWIGGIAGWLLTHQLGSDLVQLDCRRADGMAMALIALLGVFTVLLGARLSWTEWRSQGSLDQPQAGMRRFVAGTGEIAAGLFLLAILFQTMSSFVIPPCHA